MKTRILKSLLVLAMMCVTLPMVAQDFMNIYFKNGDFRKFYMKDITEIATSKADNEGIQHSDYCFQCIKTIHDKYVYNLENVDSITFSKIDEEKAEENFVTAMPEVIDAISDCETIDDVEEKIDQIKSSEGVTDAWSDGHQLYVSINNGETISFHFNHGVDLEYDPNVSEEAILSQIKALKPRFANIVNSESSTIKAVIANQQHKDENRSYFITDYYYPLKEAFESCGITAHYVPSPTIDFFYDNCKEPDKVDHLNIYDYDIIFLVTHGYYGRLRILKESWWYGNSANFSDIVSHSFCTSEELIEIPSENQNDLPQNWVDYYQKLKKWRNDSGYRDATDLHIQIGFNRELRNNEWFWIAHPSLTEFFFKDIAPGHFSNPNSIFFNSACQSLKGENDSPSYSFADTFFEHGLGMYLGYSQSDNFGKKSGPLLFSNMLNNGWSFDLAYSSLPNWMKEEDPDTYIEAWESETNMCLSESTRDIVYENLENAQLLYRSNPANSNMSSEIFILPPHTIDIDEETANDEYNKNHTVTITGNVTLVNVDSIKGLGFTLTYHDPVENTAKVRAEIVPASYSNNLVKFSAKLENLVRGRKYLYRAYTYDGIHYNWGEERCFTIYNDLSVSTEAISLETGETSTVQITAGSGQYGVTNLNSDIAKATLQGTTISINGVSVGQAQVVVTDILTGQKVIIEVTVIDPNAGNHEYVDLGLPSGTLWATCNIGATKPEEYGDFFAWGEVEPKETYTWGNYKYCNGSENTMTKYCTDSSHGTVDNKKELDPEDDVATVKWGSNWQMPSIEQQTELIDENYTTTTWTTEKGVYGRKVTSKKNGNYIFLPAAGYYGTAVFDINGSGSYWSRSLSTKYVSRSRYLYFNAENIYYNYVERRYYGQSVRPVLSAAATLSVSQKALSMEDGGKKTVEILSGSGSYSVESSNRAVATAQLRGNFIDIYGVAPGSATIIVTDVPTNQTTDITVTVRDPGANFCKDPNHPHMIDLGLPSGTKWACCNVGADIPEGYGNYYAWGETEPKDWYGYDTYIHCDGSKETCHDIGAEISGTQYDVAHVKWQGSWQMPTSVQIDELTHNCQHEMTTLNGVVGMLVTGPNGNQLFLPSAGFMSGKTLYHPEEYGLYKSGSRCDDDMAESWVLNADASAFVRIGIWNITGHTVRPVISGLELSSTGSLNIWLGKTETFSVKTGSGNYSVKSSNTSVATASISGALVSVKAMSVGTAIITVTDNKTGQTATIKVIVKDPNQPETHEYVDLGLPSGTLWATCNVGADSPEKYGNYYAWGETKTKNVYNWETYVHSNGDSDVCTDLGDISGTEYDVAHVEWGDDWRIPTYSECKELIDNCTSEWTSVGGVWGRKIIGANGNSIFLPAGGDIIDDKYDSQGQYGWYWTSHQFSGENVKFAHSIVFNQSIISLNGYVRLIGNLIRPVRKQ